MARLREEMLPKIKQFFCWAKPLGVRSERVRIPAISPVQPSVQALKVLPKVVVFGVSTGGPNALGKILPEFPADFPLPVLVVQHMPPLFTRLLAERLDSSCHLRVEEASQGRVVEPGRILIAPGDFHMKLAANGGAVHVNLDQSQRLNSCLHFHWRGIWRRGPGCHFDGHGTGWLARC
jgi:two-component system chemotaxis response regulator CheB